MSNLRVSVKISGMLDDVLSKVEVHINVKVRHTNAFWIQKSFKKKIISERINIRNCHCICNNRTGSGTTSRSDWHVFLWSVVYVIVGRFCPVDKFPNNEKVSGKAHLEDDSKFVFGSIADFWGNFFISCP